MSESTLLIQRVNSVFPDECSRCWSFSHLAAGDSNRWVGTGSLNQWAFLGGISFLPSLQNLRVIVAQSFEFWMNLYLCVSLDRQVNVVLGFWFVYIAFCMLTGYSNGSMVTPSIFGFL